MERKQRRSRKAKVPDAPDDANRVNIPPWDESEKDEQHLEKKSAYQHYRNAGMTHSDALHRVSMLFDPINQISRMFMYPFTYDEIASELDKTLTIVSVGSGMGTVEQYLEQKGFKVITIDPTTLKRDPYTSFELAKKPDYANVSEYMQSSAYDIKEEYHVLIHYPLCNYALYDICCIYDIKPKFVTIMAGDTMSGTFLLHVWLRQHGVKTCGYVRAEHNVKTALSAPNLNFVVKEKYEKLTYHSSQFWDGSPSFLTTLGRISPVSNRQKVALYSPIDEETAGDDQKTRDASFFNCINFIKDQYVQHQHQHMTSIE